MNSFHPYVLDRLKIGHDVIANIREIGEGKGKQELFADRAPDVLNNLKQLAIIESTESSNRLEGITLPRTVLEKIVREEKEPFVGNRSEGEIAGYRSVLNTIHERNEFIDLSNNVILQFHRDLFRLSGGSNGGAWKHSDNLITEKRPDGTTFVRLRPTSAWQTPGAMEALHKAYSEASESDVDALILVALYILDFLCIHPFSDGNGRMVRLLTVLLLYREEYNVARYISVERIIEATKESYYDTLYRSSQGWHDSLHDPMPWIAYFLGVIRSAYAAFPKELAI